MCEGSKIKHLFWEHLAPFKVPLPEKVYQQHVIRTCRAIDGRLQEAKERQQHTLLDRSSLFERLVHGHSVRS